MSLWDQELTRFRSMELPQQLMWFAKLLFLLTMFARETYEPGTQGVAGPEQLRLYNELVHRTASQQLRTARADDERMPDKVFFQLVKESLDALSVDHKQVLSRLQ